MHLDIAMLVILVLASLWTVMTRSLLRCAIGLALTSAVLTIIMFRLSSPLAAVFELSVCAGLISVLFVSVISLTHAQTPAEIMQHMKDRLSRFWLLPAIVVIVAGASLFMHLKPAVRLAAPGSIQDARAVLWNLRQLDVLGQIIILLTGAFGVVILFKERLKK